MPNRRTVLNRALVLAGLASTTPWHALAASPDLVVSNVTRLYDVRVARITKPRSTDEVVAALRGWPGRVSVGGGRYSMGGQAALEGSLHLDMREMKGLVWLKPEARQVRVQAGMRWRDLQGLIDPHHLAIKTMQSYANFTVGGAVSVNAHGRYVGNGPVGGSVRALQLVMADGAVIEASRQNHASLFKAAVGGYGALAVITEVELDLVGNQRLERTTQAVRLQDYPAYFERMVKNDAASVLHNADLMPPEFDTPVAVTWRSTDKPLVEPGRLRPQGETYALEQNMLWAMTELPFGEHLRKTVVHPLLNGKPMVAWRNHEASRDVAELEPRTRRISTYALQEYFIPVRHFLPFARGMADILRTHAVVALNVSVRHSPADADALVPWATEEVFSFVLYHKQRVHAKACEAVGVWTRALIDLALRHEGRYYLPYQLHATRAQFHRAYPEAAGKLVPLKRLHDPGARFSNALWDKYL